MNADVRFRPRYLLAVVLCGGASIAAAQPATPGSYVLTIPATSFTVESSSQTYDVDFTTFSRYATGAVPEAITVLTTGLTLPSGAVLDQISFEVYDNDATKDVAAQYMSCLGGPDPGAACLFPGIIETNGQPGWQWLSTGELGWTSDNFNNFFLLRIQLRVGSGPGQTMFRRAVVYYHLQVSPAPATATFNDVPTDNPYFRFVEALYAAGITAGCGGGDYCPDAPITRGQMAVFLAKALGIYWPTTPVN